MALCQGDFLRLCQALLVQNPGAKRHPRQGERARCPHPLSNLLRPKGSSVGLRGPSTESPQKDMAWGGGDRAWCSVEAEDQEQSPLGILENKCRGRGTCSTRPN